QFHETIEGEGVSRARRAREQVEIVRQNRVIEQPQKMKRSGVGSREWGMGSYFSSPLPTPHSPLPIFFGGERHALTAFDHYLLSLTHVRRLSAAADRYARLATGLRAIIHRPGPGSRTE